MTAMPQGKVRPPIDAPDVYSHTEDDRQANITITELTSYQFRDDSSYTIREFDYRLKWILETKNNGVETSTSRRFKGAVKATVYVWSVRNAEWHEVWSFWRDAESPYNTDGAAKARSWNGVLQELAEMATAVLV